MGTPERLHPLGWEAVGRMGLFDVYAACTITSVVKDVREEHLAAFVGLLASQGVAIRGRKALQKLFYFAQFQGWPQTVSYRLHLFGPYSDEVAAALDDLEARGAIVIDADRAIRPAPLFRDAGSASLPEGALHAARRVAQQFRHDDPRTLELLATLQFVWTREQATYRRTTDHQVIRQVQRYKGAKFNLLEIEGALLRLKHEGYITG